MDTEFWAQMDKAIADPRVGDIIIATGEPFRYFVFDDLETASDVIVPATAFKEIERQAGIDVTLKDDDKRWMHNGRSLRCNVLTSLGQRQICMRVIKEKPPTFATCDFPDSPALRAVVTEQHEGLIIVGGKPHSGKSTTCAAIIMEFAQKHKGHVVTFENPVEAIYPRNLKSLITQRDLTDDVLDEMKAMGSSVRQKPSLLFIQEIRDARTAYLAMALVSLGNRVIATTHAGDAVGVITSLLKWMPEDRWEWGCYMLSRYLVCSIAQRLEYAQDKNERRYSLHEVLTRTVATAAILNKAADDKKELNNLAYELTNGGQESSHITWQASMQSWRDKGVVFDPLLEEQLSR
jgi:twitching motility protein PilT